MTVPPVTPPVAETVVLGENSEDPKPKDSVAYETHRKLLAEKKVLADRLAAIEASNKAREDQELEAKGEYQRLLEQEREEKKKLQVDIATRDEKEKAARKLSSVFKALGGKIDQKWLGQIDYDQVIINPDTGEVDEMSVTKAAENFKKEWPEAFVNANASRQPNEAPAGNAGSTISYEAWKKLDHKEMAKWKPSQITGL